MNANEQTFIAQEEHEQMACQAIDAISSDLRNLALVIHDHPEISENEFFAASTISAFLKNQGFTITQPLPDVPLFPTALKAVAGGGKKKFAFLGEYDALPELGHGCGHNLIATMSVGAAIGLHCALGDKVEVAFLGCPAEETVGGKVAMAEAGVFDGYEGALIIHPDGKTSIGGTSLASHPLEVTFIGEQAHVASLHNKGINALDCLVDFYGRVRELQKTCNEYVVIGMMITNGGIAPNIIPDRGTLRMTIRAKKTSFLEGHLLRRIKELADTVASEYNAKAEYHFYEPLYKELIEDESLNAIVFDVMKEMGEYPHIVPTDQAEGSTDVGNVSHVIPIAHPNICIGKNVEQHTLEFTKAARSTYGLEQTIKGAKIMAVAALRYLASRKII